MENPLSSGSRSDTGAFTGTVWPSRTRVMDSNLPDLANPYDDYEQDSDKEFGSLAATADDESEADEFDLNESGAHEDRDDDELMDDE